MITNAELAPALRLADEGSILLAGKLLQGISQEEIAWQVIEKVGSEGGMRITLHAYWHDVFIVSKVVTVYPDDTLVWGVTKI